MDKHFGSFLSVYLFPVNNAEIKFLFVDDDGALGVFKLIVNAVTDVRNNYAIRAGVLGERGVIDAGLPADGKPYALRNVLYRIFARGNLFLALRRAVLFVTHDFYARSLVAIAIGESIVIVIVARIFDFDITAVTHVDYIACCFDFAYVSIGNVYPLGSRRAAEFGIVKIALVDIERGGRITIPGIRHILDLNRAVIVV